MFKMFVFNLITTPIKYDSVIITEVYCSVFCFKRFVNNSKVVLDVLMWKAIQY